MGRIVAGFLVLVVEWGCVVGCWYGLWVILGFGFGFGGLDCVWFWGCFCFCLDGIPDTGYRIRVDCLIYYV